MQCEIWFNPDCSKCRDALDILERSGVDIEVRRYLDQPPDRAEIERVLARLGLEDPRALMRTNEAEYAGLEKASREELIEAMVRHPILIQRPVVISGNKAVIGRPPEQVLDVL